MAEQPNNSWPRQAINEKTQAHLRAETFWFVRNLSKLIKCHCNFPGRCAAVATVLCQKFFLRQSYAEQNHLIIASACLIIEKEKNDEECAQIDVICNYSYLMIHSGDSIPKMKVPNTWKEDLLSVKKRVKESLQNRINVKLPHEILLRHRFFTEHANILSTCYELLNDGLLSMAFLWCPPDHLVAGAIYAGQRFFNFPLSDKWWEEFGITEHQLREVGERFCESQKIKLRSYNVLSLKERLGILSGQTQHLYQRLADARRENKRLTDALEARSDPMTRLTLS